MGNYKTGRDLATILDLLLIYYYIIASAYHVEFFCFSAMKDILLKIDLQPECPTTIRLIFSQTECLLLFLDVSDSE